VIPASTELPFEKSLTPVYHYAVTLKMPAETHAGLHMVCAITVVFL